MAKVHELAELQNRTHVFENRLEGGDTLARMLSQQYGKGEGIIMLAIPLGGVPVALRILQMLNCAMDLLIVRKIQIPGNTEAGFGAMTREGDIFLNEALMARLDMTPGQAEHQS